MSDRKESGMVFRVTGVLPEGQAYEVDVTGRRERPVIGSRIVAAMVAEAQGAAVLVRPSPTEAPVPVDGEDPRSVLALLEERTRVLDSQGAPRPEGVHVAGTVY